MNLLYCTYYNLNNSFAAYNRIKNLSDSLKQFNINIIIVGSGSDSHSFYFDEKNGLRRILYNRRFYKNNRHSNSMKLIGEANSFYNINLNAIISKYKIDGVIIYSPFYEIVKTVLKIAKSKSKFVVADCGEYYDLTLRTLLSGVFIQQALFKYFLLKKLDGITFSAHNSWDNIANKHNVKNIHIPSITKTKLIHRKKPSLNKKLNIVYMGKLSKREKPNVIYEALRLCKKNNCNFRFHLLGTRGHNSEEKYWLNKLINNFKDLKNSIQIYGYVEEELKEKILLEADLFIMVRDNSPEISHIFPFRLPEFLMSGNPTIISNVPPINLYLKDNCGIKYISPSNSSKELSNMIIYLSKNPSLRYKIGQEGRTFSILNYSFDAIGNKFAQFIKNLKD